MAAAAASSNVDTDGAAANAVNAAASPPPPRPTTIAGLRDIAGEFDGVLLDQFGVLHDGKTPYPRAIEAVRALHEAGKRIVVVSNSSRRSNGTVGKLTEMGFRAEWFAGAVTSGEMAHQYLLDRPGDEWRALGTRCVHLTWSSRGAISLEGLGLTVVGGDDCESADFILAHGTEAVAAASAAAEAAAPPSPAAHDVSLDELRQLLRRCADAASRRGREMPMVVANPDIVTVDGKGGLITMPGTLAQWYEEMGGRAILMGKPAAVIYEAAARVAPDVPRGRWLAVGDSLAHDVAGAAAAGTGPTLFVVGGIHAAEARLEGSNEAGNEGSRWDEAALERLLSLRGGDHGLVATPTYAAAWMQW